MPGATTSSEVVKNQEPEQFSNASFGLDLEEIRKVFIKSFEIKVKTPNPVLLKRTRSDSDILFYKQYREFQSEFSKCKKYSQHLDCASKIRALLENRLKEKGVEYRIIHNRAEYDLAMAFPRFERMVDCLSPLPALRNIVLRVRKGYDYIRYNYLIRDPKLKIEWIYPYIQILPSESSKVGRVVQALQSKHKVSGVFLNVNPIESSGITRGDNRIRIDPTFLGDIDHFLLPTFASSHLLEELKHLRDHNSTFKEDFLLNNWLIRKKPFRDEKLYRNSLSYGELGAKKKVIEALLADPFAYWREIISSTKELNALSIRLRNASVDALIKLQRNCSDNLRLSNKKGGKGYNTYEVSLGKYYWSIKIDSSIKDPKEVQKQASGSFSRMYIDALKVSAFCLNAFDAIVAKEIGNQVHIFFSEELCRKALDSIKQEKAK